MVTRDWDQESDRGWYRDLRRGIQMLLTFAPQIYGICLIHKHTYIFTDIHTDKHNVLHTNIHKLPSPSVRNARNLCVIGAPDPRIKRGSKIGDQGLGPRK